MILWIICTLILILCVFLLLGLYLENLNDSKEEYKILQDKYEIMIERNEILEINVDKLLRIILVFETGNYDLQRKYIKSNIYWESNYDHLNNKFKKIKYENIQLINGIAQKLFTPNRIPINNYEDAEFIRRIKEGLEGNSLNNKLIKYNIEYNNIKRNINNYEDIIVRIDRKYEELKCKYTTNSMYWETQYSVQDGQYKYEIVVLRDKIEEIKRSLSERIKELQGKYLQSRINWENEVYLLTNKIKIETTQLKYLLNENIGRVNQYINLIKRQKEIAQNKSKLNQCLIDKLQYQYFVHRSENISNQSYINRYKYKVNDMQLSSNISKASNINHINMKIIKISEETQNIQKYTNIVNNYEELIRELRYSIECINNIIVGVKREGIDIISKRLNSLSSIEENNKHGRGEKNSKNMYLIGECNPWYSSSCVEGVLLYNLNTPPYTNIRLDILRPQMATQCYFTNDYTAYCCDATGHILKYKFDFNMDLIGNAPSDFIDMPGKYFTSCMQTSDGLILAGVKNNMGNTLVFNQEGNLIKEITTESGYNILQLAEIIPNIILTIEYNHVYMHDLRNILMEYNPIITWRYLVDMEPTCYNVLRNELILDFVRACY